MDEHQRLIWQQMLQRIDNYRSESISLGQLVDDLSGLFAAADSHDTEVRKGFLSHWSLIEYEYELRTEPWALPGAASEETLARLLEELDVWLVRFSGLRTGNMAEAQRT